MIRLFSRYAPPRSKAYAKLTDTHLNAFKAMLPSAALQQEDLQQYNADWMNIYRGQSQLVLKPYTTQQVADIIKYCAREKLAVCPQSGKTGLVGGSVPVYDEIVLYLGHLSKILSLDPVSADVVTEAGVILETLNSYCEEKGFIVPLDLGAKGSCMIGGNVATNAGGIRFLRYGSMHANVKGLQAVTGNGDIISSLQKPPGLDLDQLIIGSEGTLGVITKVKIGLAVKPINKQAALLACNSFEQVVQALRLSKKHLSEVLSAFEFMGRTCLDIVFDRIPNTQDVFSKKYPFYVLIETSGTNSDHDYQKLEVFLDKAMNSCIVDGVIAQDLSQLNMFWRIRESIAVGSTQMGYRYVYDISLSHKYFHDVVMQVKERMPEGTTTIGYGHVGDGNLHLAVIVHGKERDYEKIAQVGEILEPFIFKYLKDARASVSAEHGIGLMKREKLHISRSPTEIEYMKKLKNLYDPAGILNPYKVLPIG